MSANRFSSADERMASLRAYQARRNQPPSIPPSVEAALRLAQSYARGGGIAPGLPTAPFQPIAAPRTVMPRIAAAHVPRILPVGRGHFADGGSTLPKHVLHALAIIHDHAREHYDDGGAIGGQFGSATTGNMQLGGLQLGGGSGPGINSGSSGVANWQPPVLTPINNAGPLGLSRAAQSGGQPNKTAANVAANVALGAFGPLGMVGAGANTLSGLLGGPTIADGINSLLSHPGAPTSVTGTSGNAPGDRSTNQYLQNLLSTSTATTSSSSSAAASNDPYSDAMAAYLADMQADEGSNAGVSSTLGVTNPLPNMGPGRTRLQPIYRPMEDPIVLRALGLV